jgi:hypothetical protein
VAWTCQRVSGGQKCRHVNGGRLRKCAQCGKPRPARRRPAHTAALELPYEHYLKINGGPHCGICGKVPAPGQRFHRDHEHKFDGRPRGLLCFPCNLQLKHTSTPEWLRAAAAYLERSA